MPAVFQRFSAIQYYLAHARNSVHAIAEVDHAVSEDAFRSLVADIVAAAPQLLWRESLKESGHFKATDVDWGAQCAFSTPTSGAEAASELHKTLSTPLHDTDRPAFRALCQTLSGHQAPKARIVIVTTHALMEGGDVADLLRGRNSEHAARPVTDAGLPLGARLGALAISPLLWALNLAAARFETKDRAAFGFAALRFDRADLRRVARSLNMGQRDLAFALVSYHRGQLPKPKAKLHAAYSSRPHARVRLCDDEVLSLRMDEITVAHAEGFPTFATRMRDALTRRGPEPMFVQTWHRRLNQIHRFLHPRVPWLYPKALFGFAPYDVVLSLLPPVQTKSAALDGAVIYAGSDTGTAESCIFAACAQSFTVTLWSGAERAGHVAEIERTAQAMGIRVSRAWGRL
ncbi:hypothetical protein [Gymnodinialimonas sp.]